LEGKVFVTCGGEEEETMASAIQCVAEVESVALRRVRRQTWVTMGQVAEVQVAVADV